jgi:uroporphyrinogen decarboxylase
MVFATMSVAETSSNPLLSVLSGKKVRRTPIWLMRQAGRYLPEYRELRAKSANFLEFCYSPRLATEATLQPVRRFGFDAAILFSDILVMPDALGQRVVFTDNGPKLKPIDSPSDLSRLDPKPAIGRLEPIFETIESVRANLGREVAVIGFCGAPWTVASYMVAGGGSADQAPSRLFAYRHRAAFQELIDLLVEVSADYLVRQLLAGANAVQIFDSWAGSLPIAEFERWCVAPLEAIVTKVRARVPAAPIIAFPRGAGAFLGKFARIEGLAALGLDTANSAQFADAVLPPSMALQGNLDPIALVAGGTELDEAIDRAIADFSGRPQIFNLGHGVLPETPVVHVERLVRRIRAHD